VNKLITIFILLIPFFGFGQKHNINFKIKECELYFKQYIGDSLYNLTIDRKVKRKDRKFAKFSQVLEYLEPKLFEKFGKEVIEKQSPYLYYMYQGYWMVWGTLPEGKTGKVFLIIMDSETGNIENMVFENLSMTSN